MSPPEKLPLPECVIEALAKALSCHIFNLDGRSTELQLRAKLALEYGLLGGSTPPFGLDKLGTDDTAAYLGVRPETLRDKAKRRILGIPPPYSYGRKLFWRRSELDRWVETQRPAGPEG